MKYIYSFPAIIVRRCPPLTVTVILLLVILWLTLAQEPLPDDTPDWIWFPGADKVVHAIMFGSLAFAGAIDLERVMSGYAACLIAWVLASLIGGAIEVTQDFMGIGRSAEWGDFVADSVGALIFAFLAFAMTADSTSSR